MSLQFKQRFSIVLLTVEPSPSLRLTIKFLRFCGSMDLITDNEESLAEVTNTFFP